MPINKHGKLIYSLLPPKRDVYVAFTQCRFKRTMMVLYVRP